MKVAAYLRVSTNDQNTDTQLHAIQSYCKMQNWELTETYTDVGISGVVDKRPELDRLKEDVRKSQIDILVVWKFDRLARSTMNLLECLKLFQTNNTSFVSVTEGIDTSTAVGKMVLTMIGAISVFERDILRERVKAGIDRARSEGVQLGRPRKGFDVTQAFKLRNDGWSYKRIAKELKVGVGTIYNAIQPMELSSEKPA
jgi:DNA invertase Pin-like site-specific DNA recombinase